jgi:hypothetical protein
MPHRSQKFFHPKIPTERNGDFSRATSALLMPSETVSVCFCELCQCELNCLRRGVRSLEVPNQLLPQQSEPGGAIYGVTCDFGVEARDHHGDTQKLAGAWRIDLGQALLGLDHAPLRGPDPAAQRDIDPDATVLVQHFFRAFQGEFFSADALPCPSHLHTVQKINHCSTSVAFRGALTSAARMARLPLPSRSRAAVLRSVVGVVLDDDRMMPIVLAGGDRAGEDGVRTVMPATVVIKGNVAVAAMMKPLTVLIDDHVTVAVVIVVMTVGGDDHIGLSRRSHSRGRHEKRHSADDHCFHCEYSICLKIPSVDNCCRCLWFRSLSPACAA